MAAVNAHGLALKTKQTRRNLPVAAYIQPAQFDAWRDY
jgi:hypothetical protein